MHHPYPALHGLLLVGALAFLHLGCKPAPCPTTPRASEGDEAGGTARAPKPLSLDPYVAAPLVRSQSVAVDVLWVRQTPPEQKGEKAEERKTEPERKPETARTGKSQQAEKVKPKAGLTRVYLRVGPNPARVSRVGISEQFPGGAGGSWRASVWIAARIAARALGREIADYSFLAESEGFIDGPSAGALFTAGFMAAITGTAVRPEASMTGTVSPDGTVGPVIGLEEKLLAALSAGKTILGYPEGNKIVEGKGGRMVNLETLAAERGAKAVPVRDIYEAFELLTGKAFPSRTLVAAEHLTFSEELTKRLFQRATLWRKDHKAAVASSQEKLTDDLVKRFFQSRVKAADVYLKASLDATGAKQPGAAYYSAARAASWAFTAQQFLGIAYLWRQWVNLLQKEEGTAKAKLEAIMRLRLQAAVRSRQEAECVKGGWKTPACRALRAQMKREAAERRKAEQGTKATTPRPGARSKPPASAAKPAKDLTSSSSGPAAASPDVPPEPPQDFSKLLVQKADEMDHRTKAIDRLRQDLAKLKPSNVDQTLALVSAYEELVQGAAFAQVGKLRLHLLRTYERFRAFATSTFAKRNLMVQTTTYVDETVKFAGIAFGKAKLAEEMAGLHQAGGRPVTLSRERMNSISNQLFAAAKANLDFIDSLLPKGSRGEAVQRWLGSSSPEYVIARLGMSQSGEILLELRHAGAKGAPIELGSGYAALGAAVASYMASSKLISKAFTLGVRHQTGAEVSAVKRPVELTNTLHRARLFALEAAHRAHSIAGMVPTFARILIQTAEQYRKESLSGQVKALELYWRAALYCQLAEMIFQS